MLAAHDPAILTPVMPVTEPKLHVLVRHSAAEKDVALAGELLQHLDPLKRFAGVDVWSEARIRPGDNWREEIRRAIDQADVALVLLSADFLAADSLMEVEVPRLVERHRAGALRVIPVLLRSCLWEVHPWLKELKPLPEGGKAIGSVPADTRDEVFTELAKEIVRLIAPTVANVTAQRDPLDRILESGTSTLPKFAGPAALLNARHQIVPFHGRVHVLEELRRWCEADGVAAVRLIHGPGGMGKTRLLIELCRRMRAKRWRTGFVPKRLEPSQFAELVASEKPVLAVVDYAESRPSLRELILPVLRRRHAGDPGRVRVVLLARTRGDWWDAALRSEVADLLRDEEPTALLPLVPQGEERRAVFREAAERFAERTEAAVPDQVPDLGDPRYDRVLYVHMAALATVEGREFTTQTLMEDTLNHEEQFWAQKFESKKDLDERLLRRRIRRVVAALTLRGGAIDEAEADALVERVGEVRDDALAMFLRDLYPGGAVDGEPHLAGLEPDLLGEAMVYRTLKAEGARVEAALERMFEGAGARAVRTGFEVLGRLSGEHAEVEGWIAPVLERDVPRRAMAAFEAAQAVGERTADAVLGTVLAKALMGKGTSDLARTLERHLPHPNYTVSLLEVSRWVLEKRLTDLSEGMVQTRARVKTKLGIVLRALGQHEAALAPTKEAADTFRRLRFRPPLANTLNSLGNLQSELGQHVAALASTREAVDIYRELAQAKPEEFLPDLAMSLSNLGVRFRHREEALAYKQEAVDIYQKLAQARPVMFLPELARCLSNLSTSQTDRGQHHAALASVRAAAEIYDKLAQTRPDAFLVQLAGTLGNLSVCQSHCRKREEAFVSAQSAVDIFRKLARRRPEVFLPDLARSLNNLGLRQSESGQHEAALASAGEALDTMWPFYLGLPDAHAEDTGRMLNNLRTYMQILDQCPSVELDSRISTFDSMRAPRL